MAALRSSLPLLVGAVLVFGFLTFLFGLVVGANLVAAPEAPPAAKPSLAAPHVVAPSIVAPPVPALPSPTLAPTSPASPAPAAPAPAPAVIPAPAAPTPAAAPPSPAASGASAPVPSGEAAPAIKPVKVKGFGFGEPPSAPPNSGLRGPLLEQAANAPPPAPALAPADSGQAAAVPPPPAAQPVKDPAPPMVYSVAVGRFLMESRAGALSSAVAAKGFSPVVVVADPPDGTGWLTVTLGPQDDATQAKRLAKEAESQGFDTWMVSWLPP
ncbi:SPOR domain-containing protein [Azospirillum sp.]|uniref:SPOR domain-containing protein n=1 Tax=Azospirillum sp. TaxID=34012 RepID=UPI002627A2A0|nr:SPOR domain-containing protein [Azospirillum sp.]